MTEPECNETHTIPSHLDGKRVDVAAAALSNNVSRSLLTKWIRLGTVTLDGQRVDADFHVKAGQILNVKGTLPASLDWDTAGEVKFTLVYEDEDIIIVDKPVGLVVHPGSGIRTDTMVNGLLSVRPALASVPRAGIVHRLDKNTTGLMVVAANAASHTALVKKIANREVSREYLAVTEGLMRSRKVDQPLGRNPRDRTKQAVRIDGRNAITHFLNLEVFPTHSLVRAVLETGRTHQIRVHASSVGCPIVGDASYGARCRLPPSASEELTECLRSFGRQALHAYRLGFEHPRTNQNMQFERNLPHDMTELVRLLRQHKKKNSEKSS